MPGVNDSAYFTNNTSYQLNFNQSATNKTVNFNGGYFTNHVPSQIKLTVNAGVRTWTVNQQAVLGQQAGQTGFVRFNTGSFMVTNAGGTGEILVGRAGAGVLHLNGAEIATDNLIATNGHRSAIILTRGGLTAGKLSVNQGNPLEVGNGIDTARLTLLGSTNTHTVYDGLRVNGNSVLQAAGVLDSDTVISSNGLFEIQGTLTHQGNLHLEAGAGATTVSLTDGDMLHITGSLTNHASLLVAGEPGGTVPSVFRGLQVDGNIMTQSGTMFAWEFDSDPLEGYYGGIRSVNNFSHILPYVTMTGASFPGSVDVRLRNDGFYYLTVIPEPGTTRLLFMGVGIGLISCHIRRRRVFDGGNNQ